MGIANSQISGIITPARFREYLYPMKKNIRFAPVLILLTTLCAVGQMTNTIYVPAMDLIANALLVHDQFVQAVMAFYLLPYGLSQFIYGPISDHFGRKPVILWGLAIFIFGSLLTVIAHVFWLLVVGSFIQGVGIGVGGVMARTVMRDLYSGKKLHQASSYVSIAFILAPITAPVIGGVLAGYFGWRADFAFLMIVGIIVLGIQYYFFVETNPYVNTGVPVHKTPLLVRYRTLLSDNAFIGYMICLFICFGGVSVFEACSGLLFTKLLGFSPQAASLLFIVPLPGYMLGSYLSGYLRNYFSVNQIILAGIALLLIGAVIMCVSGIIHYTNATVILIAASLYLAGSGIIFPAATTGAIEPFGHLAGTAGAVLGGTQNVGAGLITMISACIPQFSQLPMGIILLFLTIALIIIFRRLVMNNLSSG